MKYEWILDVLKLTVLLPIGIIAFGLEKMAPKIDEIGYLWLISIMLFGFISLICGATCLSSCASALGSESDNDNSLKLINWVLKYIGTLHLLTLTLAALVLVIGILLNVEIIYDKAPLDCDISHSENGTEQKTWKMNIKCR